MLKKVLLAEAAVRKTKQLWPLSYEGRWVRIGYLDLSLLLL